MWGTHQMAVAAIEIQALDGNNFIERDINRSVHGGAGAIPDLLQELVIAGICGVSLRTASHPSHNNPKQLTRSPPIRASSWRGRSSGDCDKTAGVGKGERERSLFGSVRKRERGEAGEGADVSDVVCVWDLDTWMRHCTVADGPRSRQRFLGHCKNRFS
ncbi:hypothetical protein CRG98_042861 [Punica granatum]|uniref:Uncharacterized protein n=1 Tax=Punica granatum TaxID=22663 RepID=A0A2I0HYG1_PUNGR|nr:hypothetical protein CRG98_042861 [Punica granatum]